MRDEALIGLNSDTLIDLLDFKESDVNLKDIAHGLSKICRYGQSLGLDVHYSVAQHSVLLCQYALEHYENKEFAVACLMHDASEAYLGDIVNGLKILLTDYKNIEAKITEIINKKYNISCEYGVNKMVKSLDTQILLDEAAIFLPQHLDTFKTETGYTEGLGLLPCNERSLDDVNFFHDAFLSYCRYLNIGD